MQEKICKYPSFFKVLVGDVSTKISVPPDFVKNFNGELPKISTLKSSAERSWGVLMEKTEDGFFFSKGWSKFVIDHRLQFGDFLVFWLTSNSTFEVSIYGHNACEKDTSFLREQQAAATPSTLLPQSLIEKANHRKMKIEPESEPVVDSMKPPNNLHFVKKLSNHDMSYNIYVPADFARETGLVSKNLLTLKYVNEVGGCEEWPVEVQKQNDGVKLGPGWFKFWTTKGLSVGDSCLFEFVDGSLHVKVLRKVIKKKDIELNNFQFVKEMTNQNMKYTIYVPADFAKDTGLVSMNMVMLKYITESGDCEDWPVEVLKHDRHDHVKLGSGWHKFWIAKGLSIGDSYLFEFIDGGLHVKVLRKVIKKKDIELNNLQFVKEMTGQNMKYNIYVPADFARDTGLVSMNSVTLKYITESGDCEDWPVKVQKENDRRVKLSSGWFKFWTAKGLCIGDSYLFEFIDGSLHVKVLRKAVKKNIELNNFQFVKEMTCQNMKYNMCVPADFARVTGLVSMNSVTLKYITESGDCEDWPVEVQKQNDHHDCVKLGSGWLKFWTAKGLCVGDSYLFEFIDGSLHVKVLRKAIKKKIELNNIQFVKEITAQHMTYIMTVPADFAREAGLVSMNSVTLKCITEGGGCEDWPVKLQNQSDRVRLGSGWHKFCTEKGLSVGDSCLFEFVDGSFHVQVLRCESERIIFW